MRLCALVLRVRPQQCTRNERKARLTRLLNRPFFFFFFFSVKKKGKLSDSTVCHVGVDASMLDMLKALWLFVSKRERRYRRCYKERVELIFFLNDDGFSFYVLGNSVGKKYF